MEAPRFDLDSSFSESFTSFDGKRPGHDAARHRRRQRPRRDDRQRRFTGTPKAAYGKIDVAAQRSRLGPIYADRTRIDGRYLIGAAAGTLSLVADYSAENADLAPSVMASVTEPLRRGEEHADRADRRRISNAIRKSGKLVRRVGLDPHGQFPRRRSGSDRDGGSPGRDRRKGPRSGGDGVTYYWPSGRLRVDGLIKMAGGGLPTGPGPATPTAQRRRDERPCALRALSGGCARASRSTRSASRRAPTERPTSTPSRCSTALPGRPRSGPPPAAQRPPRPGRRLFRRPRLHRRELALFPDARVQFGPTRLPVCPIGPAIVSQAAGGDLRVAARLDQSAARRAPRQIAVRTERGRGADRRQAILRRRSRRSHREDEPRRSRSTPAALQGTFSGSGISGTFAGARSTIGNVPLAAFGCDGRWRYFRNDLTVNGSLNLSDRSETPRFYTLQSNDFQVTLSGDDIRAGGTLLHPASGTEVTDVTIRHALSSGNGQAVLDVPGITFGEGLQPEELTRLTEGVIALVQGTRSRARRDQLERRREVTSTGSFSTAGYGLRGAVRPGHRADDDGQFHRSPRPRNAPDQSATVASINPGILVENGVIRYQLLPNQLVKVERGEWPFMGGRLILQETVLNFGRPSPKRLTFEVQGFNAEMFVDSFGFEGIDITGTFDGVLPMIFDENGGRIVGGRLDARQPGGEFSYNGTKPKAGIAVGLAFDLLSNIRYQKMTIRLDGDLAGEFATRFEIDDVSLGNRGGFVAGLARNAFKKVPMRVNLSVKGPFRALIQMAKGFKDPTQRHPARPPLPARYARPRHRDARSEEGRRAAVQCSADFGASGRIHQTPAK